MENTEARLRVRMSSSDAHYAGNLVAGAKILSLFGDVATELTIRHDGDEGLLRATTRLSFLHRFTAVTLSKLQEESSRLATRVER